MAAKFVTAIGLEHLMFEAADPQVFACMSRITGRLSISLITARSFNSNVSDPASGEPRAPGGSSPSSGKTWKEVAHGDGRFSVGRSTILKRARTGALFQAPWRTFYWHISLMCFRLVTSTRSSQVLLAVLAPPGCGLVYLPVTLTLCPT